jgi:anti-sigma regulatory factor (Ser/Thr protein kinase)
MSNEISVELPCTPATAKAARRLIADRLGDHPRYGDLLLCVSEVITNAVIHAHSAPTMNVSIGADRIRFEVGDDDPALPVRRVHDLQAPTGRGLRILDALSLDWGVTTAVDGKVVWFEFEGVGAAA